ncbi:MAG TPA: HD domain-containing phosphohydrolase [Rhodocyclaceae bacterium]
MAKLQLTLGDVEIGKPLPFELKDQAGRILLNAGYVIPDRAQLERLVDRGVFFDALEDPAAIGRMAERISVYRLVVEAADEYAELVARPFDAAALAGIHKVAQEIEKLCALDADASLAFILLHKETRYSVRHGFATAILTEVLMRELNQDAAEVRRAVAAALCMNLCMLELQDELYRQELALSLEQKQAVVLHPQRAGQLLASVGCADAALIAIVEDHHELINGAGYARRKQAAELGIATQVVSLADRFCAVASERAYRPATAPSVAARDLLSRQAATINTMLAAHFLKVIGVYPPGAVVTLANGEIAVVVRRTLHPLQPVVRSLRSRNGIRYPQPPKRLTSKESYAIAAPAGCEHLQGVDLASLWPPVDTDDENPEP